ncbi:molybdopterin-dependent oxidoreductase [Euzebya sp.]|uniref:molybdopterin-dependent oxidoreductase n=1 Tax=Euzebya sp. TaxID=1971409 RepID=UPI0035168168
MGLHYLLLHYDVPVVGDAGAWRVTVDGAVSRPLELSLDDLRARPQVTVPVALECAGNGRARYSPRALSQPWLVEAVGTGEWTGTRLASLLADAGPSDAAVEVVFTGADRGVEGGEAQHYRRSLTLDLATADEVLVVWGLNGGDLPPQHGFPLRLLVPGWYGMASVKWLRRIEVVTEPFTGYQQARANRMRQHPDDPGIDRIVVRSPVAPPGIPDFMTRRRVVDAHRPCPVEGRAWSGHGPITRVEVTTDGGTTWADAGGAPRAGTARLAPVHLDLGGPGPRRAPARQPRHRRERGRPTPRAALEPGRLRRHPRPPRRDDGPRVTCRGAAGP